MARSYENLTSAALNGEPSCHLTPVLSLKVTTVPSGLTSQDLASDGRTLPEASRRTRPWYRLSRSVVAMEAVASAVGSRAVGSWMMPTMILGLLDAWAAAAAAAAVGAVVGAAAAGAV